VNIWKESSGPTRGGWRSIVGLCNGVPFKRLIWLKSMSSSSTRIPIFGPRLCALPSKGRINVRAYFKIPLACSFCQYIKKQAMFKKPTKHELSLSYRRVNLLNFVFIQRAYFKIPLACSFCQYIKKQAMFKKPTKNDSSFSYLTVSLLNFVFIQLLNFSTQHRFVL